MNCIFCAIAEKKSPAEIIYEDDELISFLDINPFNFGHTLIITKDHFENFMDIPPELNGRMFNVVQHLAKKIMKGLNVSGLNVVINNGHTAGQTVFHSHVHIIPRSEDDGHKFRSNLKKYSNGEIKIYADLIRKSLQEVD